MNLSKIEECTHLCVFCLRKGFSFDTSTALADNLLKFKRFANLLDRFVGGTSKTRGKLIGQLDMECLLLGCCSDCLFITNSFCEIYHQFKCLELELEWNIWKLVRIMTLAGKVPSRILQLNNVLERSNVAKALRVDLIKKCNKKLARCRPRVLLRKHKLLVSTSSNVSNIATTVIDDNESDENENFEEFEPENNLDEDDNDAEIEEPVNGIQGNTLENIGDFAPEEVPSNTTLSPPPIIDPCVLSTENVLKSEPQNEAMKIISSVNKPIKLETFQSIPPTKITEQRYNLRQKKRINFSHGNNITEYSSSSEHNSGSTSSSETSDDSDCDDNELSKKTKSSSSNRRRRRRRKRRSDRSRQNMICNLDNCNKRFSNETIYQNHLKLHSHQGSFSCQFCSIVETNLIKLSNHEYKMHSKQEKKTKSAYGFTCSRCPFKATYSSDYQAHFAHSHFSTGIPPPNRQISSEYSKCEICSRKISDKLKRFHYKIWHDSTSLENTNVIKCTKEGCLAYFLRDYQLQLHYQKEHQTVEPKEHLTFQCHICLKKFPERLQLARHKLLFHKIKFGQKISNFPPTQIANISQQFPCKFCPLVKDNPSDLANHETDLHSLSDIHGTSKKPICCPRCPRKYLVRECYIRHFLNTHLNLSSAENTKICKLCSGGKMCKLNSEIHFKNFHQIREGMEPHKCEHCPAYFRKLFQLQQHKIWVHEQGNKCKFCGKCYKKRASLVGHLKYKHGGMDENPDLPFGCELDAKCKKRFGTEAELGHHQTYGHTYGIQGYKKKKKKYVCEKCEDGMDFGSRLNLQKHLANVHGDRPFVCEECGKAFKTKGALFDSHMIFHKGPDAWKWECGECGKKCATRQKFEEHARTHTKEKPFVCQFCGERYAHRHNWRNHLKGKHGDEEGVEEEIEKGGGRSRNGNYAKRKGSKKGDCIMAK